MSHPVSLQIPTETFLNLLAYLDEYGDERGPSEIAALAIEGWLSVAKGENSEPPANARGYQWKSLFLPENTDVRMMHLNTYSYAKVIGDLFTMAAK